MRLFSRAVATLDQRTHSLDNEMADKELAQAEQEHGASNGHRCTRANSQLGGEMRTAAPKGGCCRLVAGTGFEPVTFGL